MGISSIGVFSITKQGAKKTTEYIKTGKYNKPQSYTTSMKDQE